MAKTLAVTAYVNTGGPLFDGSAPEILARFEADARQAIADRGVELLRAFPMDKTGRARGGFQDKLKTVTRSNAVAIPGPMITGVVWAPWLEGTSKRNQSTGFKGYRLFRTTRAMLNRQATEIAETRLPPYLRELGGE
jgi:hypothetical protein